MSESHVLGIDVGTRSVRMVLYDCNTNTLLYKENVNKSEIAETIKELQGYGVSSVCIAGGYQWKELDGISALSDEIVALGSDNEETHGLRRAIKIALAATRRVILLPSAGASGGLPTWLLYNVLDSGTPDKVAKANFVRHALGLTTFTLVDDGCFTTILSIENSVITFALGATRGIPGRCNPGCVDSELCLYLNWPRRKRDLLACHTPRNVIEKWIEFYTSILPKPVIRGSELPIEASALGAAFWCCGKKLQMMFSDRPKYGCLWGKER